MDTVTLRLLSNPRLLSIVRGAVTAAATCVGFSPREVDGVCVAVDEACTNIIRHCYGGDCQGHMELELQVGEDRLVVILRDEGTPFHPDQVPERDLAEVRPGGLGLHLIQEIMDEVRYQPGATAGTELVLTKIRTPTDEARDGR